jgi:hypothetical protein
MRDDWKNRIEDFKEKAAKYGLKKYVIIAGNVNNDIDFSTAKSLLDFSETIGFDLSIVDIVDFCKVFAAELGSDQLRKAVNLTYEYLLDERLSGRIEYIELYKDIVDKFLDQQ